MCVFRSPDLVLDVVNDFVELLQDDIAQVFADSSEFLTPLVQGVELCGDVDATSFPLETLSPSPPPPPFPPGTDGTPPELEVLAIQGKLTAIVPQCSAFNDPVRRCRRASACCARYATLSLFSLSLSVPAYVLSFHPSPRNSKKHK